MQQIPIFKLPWDGYGVVWPRAITKTRFECYYKKV